MINLVRMKLSLAMIVALTGAFVAAPAMLHAPQNGAAALMASCDDDDDGDCDGGGDDGGDPGGGYYAAESGGCTIETCTTTYYCVAIAGHQYCTGTTGCITNPC